MRCEIKLLIEEIDNLKAEVHKMDKLAHKWQSECTDALEENIKLRHVVEMAAAGKRPDGTYNRCREAIEEVAKEALRELGGEKSVMTKLPKESLKRLIED